MLKAMRSKAAANPQEQRFGSLEWRYVNDGSPFGRDKQSRAMVETGFQGHHLTTALVNPKMSMAYIPGATRSRIFVILP
jgi:hypothetical protein